jgi:hypothetical protein
MAARVIVLVVDRDDEKHGEIQVLDDARKAERLIEGLLEAGFEAERIKTFAGAEMDMRVSHRPVVALMVDGLEPASSDGSADEEEA